MDNSFQFIVIEAPHLKSTEERLRFSSCLSKVQEIFKGEILLVKNRFSEVAFG
jgi:hypothetical protein